MTNKVNHLIFKLFWLFRILCCKLRGIILCESYIGAARAIFKDNVPIVVDRFHVAKLYRKEITRLRSKELKRLRKELTTEAYQSLRPAIKLLIKKQECHSGKDKKILSPLFKLSPAIKASYRLARELTLIYNTHHKKETATKKINEWIDKVAVSLEPCLKNFTKTLICYQDYISNYFLSRETSGFVEGINNKVKVIKRRCYGILNPKHFFQRIFLDFQGYDIFLNKQAVVAN